MVRPEYYKFSKSLTRIHDKFLSNKPLTPREACRFVDWMQRSMSARDPGKPIAGWEFLFVAIMEEQWQADIILDNPEAFATTREPVQLEFDFGDYRNKSL